MKNGVGIDIVIIKKNGTADVGASAFAEVAETMRFALRRLGADAEIAINKFKRQRRAIILGAIDLTSEEGNRLPDTCILYNLEQIRTLHPRNAHYLDLLRRCTVWDYSHRNIADLAGLGIHARHVPIGHMDEMSRIPNSPSPGIDVLFYGAVNQRRNAILDALGRRGLTVVSLEHYYGALRDQFVADAKLILNLHYYEAGIFEIVRVSHMLSNRKAVLTERHPDTEIDPDLLGGLAFAPYEGLVEAACGLIADDARREALAEAGWRCMRRRDAVDALRGVVEGLELAHV
ncbi:hypothetical protein CRT60_31345 [Azospirillum palustre]|uniref:Glycosyltransferase family 1 protein n=1 Tax=Azospirillum palustre TaxID=2044885 RepID=A0A2B8BAM6_9PROT|nr:hypothetical protein [Azospirillum palustre]PGH54297.1 hypothetical protein CRT60_31345 [Azospirillum palustre]